MNVRGLYLIDFLGSLSDTICDPACGFGSLLIRAAAEGKIRKQGGANENQKEIVDIEAELVDVHKCMDGYLTELGVNVRSRFK